MATGEISRGEPVWQAFLGEGPYGPDDWARGVALYERATGRQAPGFGVLTVPPEAHMAADLIEINRQQG